MSSSQGTVRLDANVLIIGGGFGGTWAAIRAAEQVPGVLLIDKATVARSGASTMSGGVTTAPFRDDDLEKWIKELIVLGGYAANQDWTRTFIHDQVERVEDLRDWGVPIVKNPCGEITRISSRGMIDIRCLQFSPRHAMEILREHAIKAGARIVDKVEILELLTSDGQYPTAGKVTGAIGIDVRDGTFYEIHAKRTVLATGPHGIKGFRTVDNDTGDGFAYGYRVGGRFLDMEFCAGGTFSFVWAGYHLGNYNIAVGHGGRLINALGDRFMAHYDPVRFERSELNRVVAAFVKEILEGRGPVYLDLTNADEGYWEAVNRARGGKKHILKSDLFPDPRFHPLPIEPGWSIWNGGRGGLQIDLECRTNVPGLYAVGGVARNDGLGYTSSAGTPTAYAMVTGARAGHSAALEALNDVDPVVPSELVSDLRQQIFRPLRSGNPASMDEVNGRIIDIMGSPTQFMIQNAERISNALAQIEELRSQLSSFRVSDIHELVKFHEIRNNVDIFELIYRCMEDRKESRENFYREDYPMQDDVNWLCWHTAQLRADGIEHTKQDIPFDRFEFKPAKREVKLSSVAAILRGEFDPNNFEDIYIPVE